MRSGSWFAPATPPCVCGSSKYVRLRRSGTARQEALEPCVTTLAVHAATTRVIWWVSMALGSRQAVAPTPAHVLASAQLLFDHHLVERYDNLSRVIHQPVMHPGNPVLTPDEPWEYGAVLLWGTVIYDQQDQAFKMWYMTYGNEAGGALPGWTTPVCYATSVDGIHWQRPKLTHVRFQMRNLDAPERPPLEYPVNNIVFNLKQSELGMDSPTVVKDLEATDTRFRYKMTYWHRLASGTGIYQAHSPDGIHWTHLPELLIHAGDRNTFHRDAFRNQWVVVTHPEASFYELERFGHPNDNFVRTKIEMDARDRDSPHQLTDIYSFPVLNYEGIQIGVPEFYGRDTSNRWVSYLAWSYDGENWTVDPEREQWMPWSDAPGDFDAWRRNIHNGGVIRRGDELWIYFSGRSQGKETPPPGGYLVPSGEPGFDPRGIVGSIGIGILRVDGFCSRDAGDERGSLLTRPITFDGQRLYVNADIADGGHVKAGFEDLEGRPIGGYALSDSHGATGDSVAHEMRWRGRLQLGAVGRRPVRMAIELRNASLFSFSLRDA